jgi:hypothetical protein
MGFHTGGFKEYGLRTDFRKSKPAVWGESMSHARPAERLPPHRLPGKCRAPVNVAIYNMCFATFGGGERRTAALAAHLAERRDVTLFVLSPLDISIVKSVFGSTCRACVSRRSTARITCTKSVDRRSDVGRRRASTAWMTSSRGSKRRPGKARHHPRKVEATGGRRGARPGLSFADSRKTLRLSQAR